MHEETEGTMPGHATPPKTSPLKAVFFLEQLPMLAPAVAAWVNAGHEIAAVAMPRRHNSRLEWTLERLTAWLGQQWSLPVALRRHAPKTTILWLPRPIRWDELSARMASLDADVLISAFFPHRIPASLLCAFRHGGVNLHPSRLPYFRGPSPLHHLLLRDAWHEHGGVTLHCMSDGLDEGEIIAFASFSEEYWHDLNTFTTALSAAMANLVAHAVPAWCRGQAGAKPQPEGEFDWAASEPEMTVDAAWKAEHLRRLLAFFGNTQGVHLQTGEKSLRLGTILDVLGPPQSLPPRISGGIVEFDLADARVSCRRMPWAARLSNQLKTASSNRHNDLPHIPFKLAKPLGKCVGSREQS